MALNSHFPHLSPSVFYLYVLRCIEYEFYLKLPLFLLPLISLPLEQFPRWKFTFAGLRGTAVVLAITIIDYFSNSKYQFYDFGYCFFFAKVESICSFILKIILFKMS